MNNGHVLWIDDEIEMLRPHVLFLEKKGYVVETLNNGSDAVQRCKERSYDLVFIDEMMPGLSGLETLRLLKEIAPHMPVVMVTKSEEEDIMEEAIGAKIADYLIKPVNPHQMLLTLKKNIHRQELVTEHAQSGYRQQYQQLMTLMMNCQEVDDWMQIYRKLTHWELELSEADSEMTELLRMQKEEANRAFAKFIRKHYLDWVRPEVRQRPLMSADVMRQRVFPLLDKREKVLMVVIDNLRYDQWRVLAPELSAAFDIEEELYLSILPTATQYARNALFSGLMPRQIAVRFPELWVDEDEAEGKNCNEAPLLQNLLERYGRKEAFVYHKINDSVGAEQVIAHLREQSNLPLQVLVVNFIDMLSHARTESRMIRELAHDEAAYRNLTVGWFRHSFMGELLQRQAQEGYRIVLTTDHGSIRCHRPEKVIGDRNTNTNLRYKLGKNLNYDAKNLFVIKKPEEAQLPAPNLSTSYIFASGDAFFAYPNNYNYYVSYYRNTFQHGGISMEEMLVPFVTLRMKNR